MFSKLLNARWHAVWIGMLLMGGAPHVASQQYPTKTIRIVVPLAAGGAVDAFARNFAPLLQAKLRQSGQSVIVENQPGAGGFLGSDRVVRSEPDGHTILLTSNQLLYPDLFTKGLASVLSRDLTPISPLIQLPYLLVAPTSLPSRNLKEFVAHAKANPDKLNAGVIAGVAELDTNRFKKLAGLQMPNIPYNGASQVLLALARSDVHLYLVSRNSALPMIESGKVLPLAIGSSERSTSIPAVPTFREMGYDLELSTWFGLFGPKGLPPDIVALLHNEVRSVMDSQEGQDVLKRLSFETLRATPVQMKSMVDREYAEYAAAAKAAGVKAE
jgi:tripartite-type tricarboxylate transporter receptor subunit TctC